jgi:hypothetical protein
MTIERARDVLIALLRSGTVPDGAWAEVDVDALCREADRHGVGPLLAANPQLLTRAPAMIASRLLDIQRREVALDLLREQGIREVMAALGRAAVPALLFKGTQLAYTHYPRPDLRPRLDTDVLIAAWDLPRAHRVLLALGYRPDVQAGSAGVLYQQAYVRQGPEALPHVLDMHWRLANPEVFGHVLSFEEMTAESVCIPQLGQHVRGLGGVHALLVAAVHRVAHHFDDDRLIWLYDLARVGGGLDADEWRRFHALASARGVLSVCRASLEQAEAVCGPVVPEASRHELLHEPWDGWEVTAAYLDARRPHALVVLDDLRALPDWRGRLRVVRSHMFPPARYMREIYAPRSRAPVAWLYAVRAVRGARRWLSKPGTAPPLDTFDGRSPQ